MYKSKNNNQLVVKPLMIQQITPTLTTVVKKIFFIPLLSAILPSTGPKKAMIIVTAEIDKA